MSLQPENVDEFPAARRDERNRSVLFAVPSPRPAEKEGERERREVGGRGLLLIRLCAYGIFYLCFFLFCLVFQPSTRFCVFSAC